MSDVKKNGHVYFMAHPSGWVIVKYTSPPPCNLSHGQGRRPEPHTADLLRRQENCKTVLEGQAVNTRLIETRPGSGSLDFNLTRILFCYIVL